jgi:polyvinyl alcohol dehydrogenase (cytochrome)
MTHRRRLVVVATMVAGLGAISQTRLVIGSGPSWATIGNDPENSRNQPSERGLSTATVKRLAPKWIATTAGDVSATPAVADGAVYFGDFGGTLWKLDARTGRTIWSRSVPDYTGIAGDFARTSPALTGNTLVVGDIRHANLLGIDAATGNLRWITEVHPDPRGVMTGSPVLAGDTIYTGVSATGAGGRQATFRGAIVALNPHTGRILWRTYSLPDNHDTAGGYAGATMFAAPTVDLADRLVFGTFGQPYVEPAAVTACHATHGGFTESCEQPGAYFRSIAAFDVKTGEPRWSYRVQGHDSWVRACGGQPATVTWCATEADVEKWDLGGAAPNLMRIRMNGTVRSVVGVGEKSGVYLLLDAKTGGFLWNTLLGPGGDQGGMEWGTASDGRRIYASITNHHHIPYTLTPSGAPVTGGSWAALDPVTGNILWQTGDPQGQWDLAPVSVANGVVYASSMAKTGDQMFALDAATGAILWRFSAGGSVNSGPSIVNGTVYWGSGYARSAEGSGNNKLYAFSLDGK